MQPKTQDEILRSECVVHRFIETGEQPDENRYLTVCGDHCDRKHPEVRSFFNEIKRVA